MSESQLYAAAGAGTLALCAYIQARNNQQRQWLRLVRETPESSVAAVWEQLERLEQSTVGKRARPVIFVKLKGETWAPERDAVPDRFGKPAVLVETQTFAERWKCVPLPAQTKRSNDASPAEDVRYHWEREVQLLDTSRRGSSLFLRDPTYVEGVQDAQVERWMQGRVDACNRILRLCPGQEQVAKECDLWRKDLQDLRRAQAGVHVSASDELRRWEAANVRVDEACFNWKDMLSHNSCKITPVNQEPSIKHGRYEFVPHTTAFPPPRSRSRCGVVLIGRELLLMAHVTWEPSVRGRRLVATRASRDKGGVICVCSSEEEVVAKLSKQISRVDVMTGLLATMGLWSMTWALRKATQNQDRSA